MNKWKTVAIIAVSIVLVFLWIEIISSFRESSHLSQKNNILISKIKKTQEENNKLQDEIKFYGIPENLEKKLCEGFNYKNPGEKMIIVVPQDQ